MNMKSNHIVASICIVGAAVVASTGNDGWGWLLFVGVLIAS